MTLTSPSSPGRLTVAQVPSRHQYTLGESGLTALITLGLLLVVFGLLEKGNHPLLSFSVLGWAGIGVLLLIGFALVEAQAAQPWYPSLSCARATGPSPTWFASATTSDSPPSSSR